MKAIIGTKIGMTQLFDEHGKAIPVTLIHSEPNVVTQVKRVEKDGYQAVQLGAGARRNLAKPEAGHLKRAGITSVRTLREIRVDSGDINLKEGERVDLTTFQEGDFVQVTSISKGKGFAGVIKRHGFHRSPETHGADHQRQPGAIGSQRPQRVLKGKSLPGKMGSKTVTVKNLRVEKVDPDRQLLALRGAVPGPNKGTILIQGVV